MTNEFKARMKQKVKCPYCSREELIAKIEKLKLDKHSAESVASVLLKENKNLKKRIKDLESELDEMGYDDERNFI